ncbi:MAG: hypothetical protein ACREPU_07350 [Rhodanobacteraceae bacterium]
MVKPQFESSKPIAFIHDTRTTAERGTRGVLDGFGHKPVGFVKLPAAHTVHRCAGIFHLLVSLLVLVVAAGVPATAFASSDNPWDGNWRYSISPSAWLPGINADLRFQAQGQSLDNSSSDLWDHLSGAFMLSGDMRKGNWGMYGDIDWVKFNNQEGRIRSIDGSNFGATGSSNTRWGLKGGMVTFAGMYTLGHGTDGYADLLFGARYLWIKGNLSWDLSLAGNQGNVDLASNGHQSRNTHVTNAIVGIKGRWTPGNGRFFVPYYFDVGLSGSDPSGQAELGAGYAFGWGDVALAWRYLRYRQNSEQTLLRSVDFTGPTIILTWQF